MKVGDLVVRTYGEGRRPMALFVGRYNAESVIAVSYTHLTLPTTPYV